MAHQKSLAFLAIAALCWFDPSHTAGAQTGRPVDTPGRLIEVSAEDLGKQFAPDTPEPVKTYQGRVLRVAGRVAMAHEPYVYLGTGSNFPTGQPVRVTLDYTGGTMPEVAAGDRVIIEGKVDRTGIFGPILKECRLTRQVNDAKVPSGGPGASASPRAAVKKGRIARNAIDAGDPSTPADPRAVVLRFDGPVREGETGYRPQCTSFRLRFGPGKWRGTVVGRSIAWGDGNQNKDYWGAGSGEPTLSSEVYEDARGAYFVFSVNGTEWESERIAVLLRLTLPDGSPGLATALIPVGKGS